MKSETSPPPLPAPAVGEKEDEEKTEPVEPEQIEIPIKTSTTRTLNINIVEARGLGSRDKNGGSNPFALLYDPLVHKDGKLRTKMKTKIVKKTLSPVWNAEFKM